MAIVMKADSVVGDSKLSKHEGWIDVMSLSFNAMTQIAETAGGFSGGTPNLGEVHLTTIAGKHTPNFWAKVLQGKHFTKVEIEDLITGGDKDPVLSQKITMEHVFIGSTSASASGGNADRGMETWALAYETLELEWFTQDEKGAVKSVGSHKYDNKAKKLIK